MPRVVSSFEEAAQKPRPPQDEVFSNHRTSSWGAVRSTASRRMAASRKPYSRLPDRRPPRQCVLAALRVDRKCDPFDGLVCGRAVSYWNL